ncbi:hypothetical protein SY88_21255 [Clostridiales bacterium PH28_bin88]|nr:hypothetical protein SY88_21255 [Clostridiales bacterium PH28_bin88]
MTITETLLFSVPEAIVITWLAFSLSTAKSRGGIFKIGVILGVASHFFRLYTGSYIVNVILYTVLLWLLFSLYHRGHVLENLVAVVMAVSIYLTIEFINITVLQTFFHVNLTVLSENLLLRLRSFFPQVLVTALLSLILTHFDLGLFQKTREVTEE